MPTERGRLLAAISLGAASGSRTFGPWSGLIARRHIGHGRLRTGLIGAAVCETLVDKHPAARPRSEPPALAGRVISGALAGRLVAGARGAVAGAISAAATTHASQRARAMIGERTGLPDPLLGLIEDVLVISVATTAAGAASPGNGDPVASER